MEDGGWRLAAGDGDSDHSAAVGGVKANFRLLMKWV